MTKATPHCLSYFQLYRTTRGVVVQGYNELRGAHKLVGSYLLPAEHTVTSILEATDHIALLDYLWLYCVATQTEPDNQAEASTLGDELLPPLDQQVVWAAGVTYESSKFARMEESVAAKDCYAHVYDRRNRPELFFKALSHQVVGHGRPVRMSSKSKWFVPEPEFVLAINSRGEIAGYSLGNDMSARDIEGENPLYLPQAKVYDDGFALGPCITIIREGGLPLTTSLSLSVRRGTVEVFNGSTTLAKFNRTFDGLRDRLFEDRSFPGGVMLSTGTCVVPTNETVVGATVGGENWTLEPGDDLRISADRLGTLQNVVYRR